MIGLLIKKKKNWSFKNQPLRDVTNSWSVVEAGFGRTRTTKRRPFSCLFDDTLYLRITTNVKSGTIPLTVPVPSCFLCKSRKGLIIQSCLAAEEITRNTACCRKFFLIIN